MPKEYVEKTEAQKEKIRACSRRCQRRNTIWRIHWRQVALYQYFLKHHCA